jgi:hypothetical protein
MGETALLTCNTMESPFHSLLRGHLVAVPHRHAKNLGHFRLLLVRHRPRCVDRCWRLLLGAVHCRYSGSLHWQANGVKVGTLTCRTGVRLVRRELRDHWHGLSALDEAWYHLRVIAFSLPSAPSLASDRLLVWISCTYLLEFISTGSMAWFDWL